MVVQDIRVDVYEPFGGIDLNMFQLASWISIGVDNSLKPDTANEKLYDVNLQLLPVAAMYREGKGLPNVKTDVTAYVDG